MMNAVERHRTGAAGAKNDRAHLHPLLFHRRAQQRVTPIAIDGNRPEPGQRSFQRMQPPTFLVSVAEVRRLAAYVAVQTGFGYAEILNMDLAELAAWASDISALRNTTGQ